MRDSEEDQQGLACAPFGILHWVRGNDNVLLFCRLEFQELAASLKQQHGTCTLAGEQDDKTFTNMKEKLLYHKKGEEKRKQAMKMQACASQVLFHCE